MQATVPAIATPSRDRARARRAELHRRRVSRGAATVAFALAAAATTSLLDAGATVDPASSSAADVGGAPTEVLGATTVAPGVDPHPAADALRAVAGLATQTAQRQPRRATLAFTGDVLIHRPVSRRARADAAAAGREGYDFAQMLAPVAPRLRDATVAICHLETPLSTTNDDLSGYPTFRAPTEVAAGLADAGFDGCSVSSNHALDKGPAGVAATLDVMDAAGLRHTGTARSAEEAAAPSIYDAAGIRVGHLSYSYGFNGFRVPAAQPWLANAIDPDRIVADASATRAAGAELVVVSLHWGTEYRHDPTPAQRSVAERLAASGLVDLVVGHHAHVVQPVTKVGDMWVVYGLGNLLSSNADRCCPKVTIDGLLATVGVADGPEGPEVSHVTVTPTYNERRTFRVVPVADGLDFLAPGDPLAAELRRSWERTIGHVFRLDAMALGVAPDRTPRA